MNVHIIHVDVIGSNVACKDCCAGVQCYSRPAINSRDSDQ